jgi:ATP-binding cassette subfamily F protein 3
MIKLLAGDFDPLSGQRIQGRGLAVGYFAQHQLEQLRPDESPLWHLVKQEPRTREQDLRDYLGGFDFRGAMAEAPVEPFSGGEKSRLALALLVRRRPNLLLLDEPTNHLDLDMRHALTKALAEYEGSLVLVSHDRALLRTVCDGFLLVADGRVRDFDGDLDDYLSWLQERRSGRSSAPAAPVDPRRQAPARSEKQKAARRRPLAKEAEKLERQIADWQAEKRRLDGQLDDPAFYADAARAREAARRQQEVARLIDSAEHRWLELCGEIEALDGA